MHAHPRARREELVHQHERRALPHVVGLRLERQSPHADRGAPQVGAEPALEFFEDDPFLPLVGRLDRLEDVELHATVLPRVNQRLHVLRKA